MVGFIKKKVSSNVELWFLVNCPKQTNLLDWSFKLTFKKKVQIGFRHRESEGSYIRGASSKNNFTWGWGYHSTLSCVTLSSSFLSCHHPPHFSFLSMPFLVSVRMPLSIWPHVRLTTALLRPFATALFPEGNARMLYWLCHRESNTNHNTSGYSDCCLKVTAIHFQQFAEVHLWPLRLTTEQNQRSVIINFRAHLAMALPILQADCDSHVWQCSTKIITKLLENDSQSVDRHTDRHYFPAEYFSAWRKH